MDIAVAPRLIVISVNYGERVATLAASAGTGDNGVKTTIITGLFAIIAALVGGGALLLHGRNPDHLDDLLEVHERLAVIETNQADMREDYHDIHATVKAILHRLEGHRE